MTKREREKDVTAAMVVELLKRRRESAGTTRALAGELQVNEVMLAEVLRGTRKPGPQILGALGLVKRVTYVVAADADGEVAAAAAEEGK